MTLWSSVSVVAEPAIPQAVTVRQHVAFVDNMRVAIAEAGNFFKTVHLLACCSG